MSCVSVLFDPNDAIMTATLGGCGRSSGGGIPTVAMILRVDGGGVPSSTASPLYVATLFSHVTNQDPWLLGTEVE